MSRPSATDPAQAPAVARRLDEEDLDVVAKGAAAAALGDCTDASLGG
jgi:hypothetical protein